MKILTECSDFHSSGCWFPDAICRGTGVGTSLGSVGFPDGQPLTNWVCDAAESADLCPRDMRRRVTVANAFKAKIISFSKVVARRR